MKEERLKEVITHIDFDPSMDQRIIQQLLIYDTASDPSRRVKWFDSRFVLLQKRSSTSIAKAAAAILLFAVLGTTTVFAAGYFIKSYKVKKFDVIPNSSIVDSQYNTNHREETHFGDGHENISGATYDPEGNLISSYEPSDTNKYDVKYGNEAFDILDLPNLTPTYLYDHYLVEKGGYCYIEGTTNDGIKYNYIAAGFFAVNSSKYVFIQYRPTTISTKDTSIQYEIEGQTIENYKTSTYTTKSGITCNLIEDKEYDQITAHIFFDSNTLGSAEYLISCSCVQMDEVKDILDSIPFTEASEVQ